MTKEKLLEILEDYADDEEIDLAKLEEEEYEAHQRFVEELEEYQHQSGFYAFQDLMDMWRRER